MRSRSKLETPKRRLGTPSRLLFISQQWVNFHLYQVCIQAYIFFNRVSSLLLETKKKTGSGGNDRYLYAVTEMQGWRFDMEDAHVAVLDLDGEPNSNCFFAVYDGHGGGRVSKYAGENLHKRLLSEDDYHERNYDTALKKAFLGTDEDLLATDEGKVYGGATAVAALLTADNKIYVANAGDSRSVIDIKGEAEPLSFDHKPTNEPERARICAAGGYVACGRVNANLALSRALGDFQFKKNNELTPEKQIVTADPDVICHEVTEEDEFLVLACDGIWDCLSSQQVVDIVRYEISEGKELSEITELICDHCLAPDEAEGDMIGRDNMTVLIVAILHGRSKEGWYSWIADRPVDSCLSAHAKKL
ncbi:Protein phosphatase 2C (PP2C)-like domain containing protein [Amanita muscaria]